MGNDVTKIMTGLYVSGRKDARDPDQLRKHGITHVLSVHNKAKSGTFGHIQYLCIDARDNKYENLSQFFPVSNEFIHSARASGGNVLIHCKSGRSRSVTLLLAYLMTVTGLSLGDSLDVVEWLRHSSKPNSGFLRQLGDYEDSRLPVERGRLRTMYFAPEMEVADREEGIWLVNKKTFIK